MTQYLITTFVDVYGQTYTEATKARGNQAFTVVEAESKEEAIKKYNLYAKNRQVGEPKTSVNQ
ncbi:DUF1381 domain-containing protein [Staphylococcus delphini]|uniref:DUF1381 domain-containing protein n=1 Tax=Staphylococcus delphini TaxID=53344 RepID=A0AAX0QU41_9STAP|nr:DUF1381 domain-containing protein [Staphylococcus delphini]PCF50108.1 hypothetical protein B5C07_07835 [Staphylococcus delphini]PNZ95729.1 DUF1381 domain-containing protein [Staphylococcus delphini]RIZ56260.1 DUF1381 domain-containing protein [Staphylococcus delphini]VED62491.1 phage protein [Staphylococcus delphini]